MNRHTITLALVALILILSPALGAAGHEINLSLAGQLFISADSVYRDLHGRSEFMPQLSLEFGLNKKLLAWTDLGFFSSRAELTDLDAESRVSRLHGGIGLGYRLLDTPPLRLSLLAGLGIHHFREEALDLTQSSTRLGFKTVLWADWLMSRAFFLRLGLTYSTARHHQDDLSLALGGFAFGAGIGLRL